jgi:siroheme synthase-like protein
VHPRYNIFCKKTEYVLTEPKAPTTAAQQNQLFPVFLKMHELHTLIVGGGLVGEEKITAVIRNSPEATVTLVAPLILPEIRELARNFPTVTLLQREYTESDLEGKDLVIVATDDKALNRQIKQQAKARKILANVADTPDECDFYLSSIVQKGNLKIAISTNGKSPTVAKRVKEVLTETFPDELETLLDNLQQIRNSLTGNFAEKVKQLNSITAVLVEKPNIPPVTTPEPVKPAPVPLVQHIKHSWRYRVIVGFACLGLMISGHLLFSLIPLDTIGGYASLAMQHVDANILWFMLAGFVAQMIDGALGMAYGVSATTFLLTVGVPPAFASASVHASEIFTSGVSGLMHLRFRNVNSKLFKNLLLPGIIGAILGAYVLTSAEDYIYIIKPLVAAYTLVLGGIIIKKALKKTTKRKPIKKLGVLATAGGFLDSVGGGGWGPIVSSSLIASGRSPLYTIGSVNLAEFFVSLASSLTFITLIGFNHWQIVAGLVLGGVVAAPIAAILARKLPIKTMMILVGIIVIVVSLRNIITMLF